MNAHWCLFLFCVPHSVTFVVTFVEGIYICNLTKHLVIF